MGLRPGRAKGPWVGDNIPTGVVNAGANVGAGTGLVFRDITGNTINLRTLSAGTAVSIVTAGDIITITNTAPESTTVSNVGTGTGQVYRDMTVAQINLKTIKQGTGITVTNNADDVTITCTVTGESTTVANVGTGTGQVYRDMTVAQINLKTIKQGTGITVTNNADDVTITNSSPESTTVANVGTGTGQVYRDMTVAQVNLKTIKQGTGITVTNNADDVTITCTVTGESTTVTNVGTGTGNVYRDMTGAQINLKTIKQGTGITVTNNADDVTITNSSPESTTVANVGTGTGQVYRDMTVAQINLKTIKQGTGITVTNNADDVTITCTVTGTIGGSGTIDYYARFTAATTIGDGDLVRTAGGTWLTAPKYYSSGGTSADPELRMYGNATDAGSVISARTSLGLVSSSTTTSAQITLNSGVLTLNANGADVDTNIYGSSGSSIARVDAGDNAFQIPGRLVYSGVITNVGAAFTGGTSAAPTDIDLASVNNPGEFVRLSPASAANAFYNLTNPKNYQVVRVINESQYNAYIRSYNGSETYQIAIPASNNFSYGAVCVDLIHSPNAGCGNGSWIPVHHSPQALAITLTDAATIAVDARFGDCIYSVQLGGNRTLGNPSNPTRDGQRILFRVYQDGSGNRTLAYDTQYRFSTDLPSPTLSTGANKLDYLGFIFDKGNTKWDFVGKVFGF